MDLLLHVIDASDANHKIHEDVVGGYHERFGNVRYSGFDCL